MTNQPWQLSTGSLAGLACPTCGSDNVRAFSIVHAEGRHTSIVTGGAIGESGGRLSYGSFSGRTLGQSDLSKPVAPPAQRGAVPAIVGCVGALIILIFLASVGIASWLLELGVVAVVAATVALDRPRRVGWHGVPEALGRLEGQLHLPPMRHAVPDEARARSAMSNPGF